MNTKLNTTSKARGAAGLLFALTLGVSGACTEAAQQPLTDEDLQGLSDQEVAALLEDGALDDLQSSDAAAGDTEAGPDSVSCHVSPALSDRGSQIEIWAYGRCSKRVSLMEISHTGKRNGSIVATGIASCSNNFQCQTGKDYVPDPAGSQYWETLAWLDVRETSSSGWLSYFESVARFF